MRWMASRSGGAVKLQGVISQGCTPIGETWTLTRVDGQLIHEIGNRPAYEVLAETFNSLSRRTRKKSRGNLLIGLVVNEYLEDFHRGDFLVRQLLGADPQSRAIAVGALPRMGQTVQFHRRDARAATEDMGELLARARTQLGGAAIFGGCLCSCNGRGRACSGSPITTRGWSRNNWARSACPASFATAKSGRWASSISSTATRLRSPCS